MWGLGLRSETAMTVPSPPLSERHTYLFSMAAFCLTNEKQVSMFQRQNCLVVRGSFLRTSVVVAPPSTYTQSELAEGTTIFVQTVEFSRIFTLSGEGADLL